jgi:hypothetical protein
MTKKIIVLALCSLLLAPCSAVEAQQPTKLLRIGYLAGPSSSAISERYDAFLSGLRELGYTEGKTLLLSVDQPLES